MTTQLVLQTSKHKGKRNQTWCTSCIPITALSLKLSQDAAPLEESTGNKPFIGKTQLAHWHTFETHYKHQDSKTLRNKKKTGIAL